jgi:hypothetical protein
MNPASSTTANPSDVKPSPLMCEWGAIRGSLPEDVDGSRKVLLAPGTDVDSVELMMEKQK